MMPFANQFRICQPVWRGTESDFKIPTSAADKKVFLEFEGIRHGGEFYLNGTFIGRHENG